MAGIFFQLVTKIHELEPRLKVAKLFCQWLGGDRKKTCINILPLVPLLMMPSVMVKKFDSIDPRTTLSTSRTSSTTQRTTFSPPKSTSTFSTTSAASPLSIFRDDGVELSGVNALELELLSRISGTRRDSRPIRIGSNQLGVDQVD